MNDNQLLEVRLANPADAHPELRSTTRPSGPNNFSNTPADGVLRFTNAADVSSSNGPRAPQKRRFDALPLPSIVFRMQDALNDTDQFTRMYPAARDKPLDRDIDVSFSRAIANAMGMRDKTIVSIARVPLEEHTISHVELYFRDQFIGRADMWRLSLQLEDTCVYVNQKVTLSNLVRATVGRIFIKERTVSSGYVSASTKTIFRSDSAKFHLFIQMSKEMWDFDEDGELYNEKAIHGFLPELLRRWSAVPTNHLVSVVLFGRVLYEEHELHMLEDWPVRRDEWGRAYVDYYKVILDCDPAPNWVDVMGRLKEEVFRFQHDILIIRRPVSGPVPLNAESHHELISDHTLTAGRLSASYEGNILEAVNLALNPFDRNYVDRDLNRTGFSISIVTAGTGRFEVPKQLLRATTDRMVENGVALDLVCLTKMPLHAVPLFQFWSSVPDVDTLPSATKTRNNVNQPDLGGGRSGSRTWSSGPNNMTFGGTSRSSFGQSFSNAKHTYGSGPGIGATRNNRYREVGTDANTGDDVKAPDPLYYDDPPLNAASDGDDDSQRGGRGGHTRDGIVQSTQVMFFSLPHWIDCSFFNVQKDKPFRGDRFVPRSKMYDIQMMGVMENQVAGISIPYLDMVPVPPMPSSVQGSSPFSIPVHSKLTLAQIRRAQKTNHRFGSTYSGSPSTYRTMDATLGVPDARVNQILSASPANGLTPLYAAAQAAGTKLTPAFGRAVFDRGVMADVEAQNEPDQRIVLRPRLTAAPDDGRKLAPQASCSQSPAASNSKPASNAGQSLPRSPGQARRAVHAPKQPSASLITPGVGGQPGVATQLHSPSNSARVRNYGTARFLDTPSKRDPLASADSLASPPVKTKRSHANSKVKMGLPALAMARSKSQTSLHSGNASNRLKLTNMTALSKAPASVATAAPIDAFPAINEPKGKASLPASPSSRLASPLATALTPISSKASLSLSSSPSKEHSQLPTSDAHEKAKENSPTSAIGSAWRTSTQWLLKSLKPPSSSSPSAPPSTPAASTPSLASRQIREILATSGYAGTSSSARPDAVSEASTPSVQSHVRPGLQSRRSTTKNDADKRRPNWWSLGFLSRRNTDEVPVPASEASTEPHNRTPIHIPGHTDMAHFKDRPVLVGSGVGDEDDQRVDESDDEMLPEWTGLGGVVSQLGLPRGAIKFLNTQTLVNPSKPNKFAVGNNTTLMRWQYLFPHRLNRHEVKWRSMTSPACLPLTASQLPEAQDLMTHWKEHPYVASVSSGTTSLFLKQSRQSKQNAYGPRHMYSDRRDHHAAYIPPETAVSVLKEMVYQRLSRGFQFIVPTTTLSTLNNFVEKESGVFGPKAKFTLRHPSESFMPGLITAGNPIFLSLSNQIHRISFDQQSGQINVKRYLKHITYSTAPIQYACCVWARDLPGYQNVQAEFQFPSSAEYNWTYLDGCIAGHEDRLVEGLKYWRARFIVVPKLMDDSEVAELMASKRDLSLEEIRIAGMSRLASELHRFRLRKSGEPRQAFSFLMTSLDPTQSLYDELFLRNLELFHKTWPSYTGTGSTAAHTNSLGHKKGSNFADTPRSALAAEMTATTAPGGAKLIEDHRWRRVTYPNSFYGSELVSWLTDRFDDVPDRSTAVTIGNQLLQQGFLEHVRHVHDFKDGHYFYSLTKDWQQIGMGDKPTHGSSTTSTHDNRSSLSNSRAGAHADSSRHPHRHTGDATGWSSSQRRPGPKRQIQLSRSIAFDVGQYYYTRRSGTASTDDVSSRDRAEVCIIHHDISHNPMNGFNFQIHWMATTSLFIEELVQNWSRMLEKEGLILVEAPIEQISNVSQHNPFQAPRQIRLAFPPPPVSSYAHKLPEHMVPDAYFEFCLLRHWGFVLDQEASTRYPVDVEVDYQSRPKKFERSQFVHRSGLAFCQILGGSEGFLWLDNRLYNSSQLAASASFGPGAHGLGSRAHHQHTTSSGSKGGSSTPLLRSRSSSAQGPAPPRLTAEGIRNEFEAFCSNPFALQTFYRRILVRIYAGEVPVGTEVAPSEPSRVCHMASQHLPDFSPLLESSRY